MRIVDVGCGNGEAVRRATELDCQAWGVDIRHEVARSAQSRCGTDRFVVGAATRLPVLSDSVDLVVAQHIVEHLLDPMEAIREWKRVLRPGGKLAIVTPNHRYPDPSIYEDPDHVRIFDAQELRRLLEAAAMRPIGSETIFPYLGGHTVFGLRHYRILSALPPWSSSGRSLLCVAKKPLEEGGR